MALGILGAGGSLLQIISARRIPIEQRKALFKRKIALKHTVLLWTASLLIIAGLIAFILKLSFL